MITLSRGKIKDHTNERFGRLLVLTQTNERTSSRHVVWKCLCDCGNECFVSSNSLVTRKTRSCGCLERESRGIGRITHHMSNTKIYKTWQGMRNRCFKAYHKNFKDYGGRGITVCDEWNNDFQIFFDYVSQLPHFGEEGYSLDRINNDGNYEPNNVKWSTQKEQANNRRKRTKKEVEHQIKFNDEKTFNEIVKECKKGRLI